MRLSESTHSTTMDGQTQSTNGGAYKRHEQGSRVRERIRYKEKKKSETESDTNVENIAAIL